MKLRFNISVLAESATWFESPWGLLSFILAVVAVASSARFFATARIEAEFSAVLKVAFLTYDFSVVAAVGSLVWRERSRYPASMALLLLVVSSCFLPGSVAWLPLMAVESLYVILSPIGLVATACFAAVLCAIRTARFRQFIEDLRHSA